MAKYTKLIVGGVIAAAALWIILQEQMAGASANAFINAPVVTLRAPVAGDLRIAEPFLGRAVEAGEVLARIEDPFADDIRLNDLMMQLKFEQASLARIEDTLEASLTIRGSLLDRSQTYRSQRLDELQIQLSHARSRLAIIETHIADGGPFGTVTLDDQTLAAIENESGRLPAEPRLDALLLDHARERVAVLEVELEAAQRGVFLGDGYNDSPNSEQRMVDLDLDIRASERQIAETRERMSAVLNRVEQERQHVTRLTEQELRSPVSGILWEILQADKVNVQRGDPILRLVDCGSLLVTLSVTERVFNRLEVGQSAHFRLGGSSQLYDATIVRLAGSGAETVYDHLAVAPSERHLQRFDVALLVPELVKSGETFCPIGRTGRVFFETRPLDWLRSLLRGDA